MAQYFSPGVYIEEYDNSSRTIEGVGTSIAGFVGLAEKGQTVGTPVFITSYREFTKQFGKSLSEFEYGEYRYLASSVEQFFANGGTEAEWKERLIDVNVDYEVKHQSETILSFELPEPLIFSKSRQSACP